MQVKARLLFRGVRCWPDHRRCRKRDQNHSRVERQEGYSCQGMGNHPVTSDDCLLAMTCML